MGQTRFSFNFVDIKFIWKNSTCFKSMNVVESKSQLMRNFHVEIFYDLRFRCNIWSIILNVKIK